MVATTTCGGRFVKDPYRLYSSNANAPAKTRLAVSPKSRSTCALPLQLHYHFACSVPAAAYSTPKNNQPINIQFLHAPAAFFVSRSANEGIYATKQMFRFFGARFSGQPVRPPQFEAPRVSSKSTASGSANESVPEIPLVNMDHLPAMGISEVPQPPIRRLLFATFATGSICLFVGKADLRCSLPCWFDCNLRRFWWVISVRRFRGCTSTFLQRVD